MEGTSRKRSWTQYYLRKFKTKENKKPFDLYLKNRLVLAERAVTYRDFVGEFAFIPRLFEESEWMSLIVPSPPPFSAMVKEFYANIEPINLHFFCTFVRDTPFEVNASPIGSIIGAPIVFESVYPYLPDTFPEKTTMMRVFVGKNIPSWPHQNVVVKIVQFSEPMRILSRIVSANLWLVAHYNDFGIDRAAFLHAFATRVPIDFSTHAIRLMLVAYEDGQISLPFGCLIIRICTHLEIEHEENDQLQQMHHECLCCLV